MGLSGWEIALIAMVAFLLFGRGRISGLMTDLAQGIRAFSKELADTGTETKAGEPQHQSRPETSVESR